MSNYQRGPRKNHIYHKRARQIGLTPEEIKADRRETRNLLARVRVRFLSKLSPE